MNTARRIQTPLRLTLTALLLWSIAAPARPQVDISGSLARRFDGIATHGWESEAGGTLTLTPALRLGVRLGHIDATQDTIAGIQTIRALVGRAEGVLHWQGPGRHIVIDAAGGVDAVHGWKVRPRGELQAALAVPLPPRLPLQHLTLTPQGWYTHSQFNAPAVRNRVASTGFSANLGWSMGPRMAAAVNYRHEWLVPASHLLDSTLTGASMSDLPVDTDTLPVNMKQGFYLWFYRQVFTPLYLGYAFSWTTTEHDRRVLTDHQLAGSRGQLGAPSIRYSWAYYPYPTPRNMLAHLLSVSSAFTWFEGRVRWNANVAFPLYSRQELRYLPRNSQWVSIGEDQSAWDRSIYDFFTERFTGPLTMGSSLAIAPAQHTTLTLSWDWFSFPYEAWGYFSSNRYSLHTLSVAAARRF